MGGLGCSARVSKLYSICAAVGGENTHLTSGPINRARQQLEKNSNYGQLAGEWLSAAIRRVRVCIRVGLLVFSFVARQHVACGWMLSPESNTLACGLDVTVVSALG